MIVGCMWFDIPAAHIWLVIPKAPAEYKSDCEAKKQSEYHSLFKAFCHTEGWYWTKVQRPQGKPTYFMGSLAASVDIPPVHLSTQGVYKANSW